MNKYIITMILASLNVVPVYSNPFWGGNQQAAAQPAPVKVEVTVTPTTPAAPIDEGVINGIKTAFSNIIDATKLSFKLYRSLHAIPKYVYQVVPHSALALSRGYMSVRKQVPHWDKAEIALGSILAWENRKNLGSWWRNGCDAVNYMVDVPVKECTYLGALVIEDLLERSPIAAPAALLALNLVMSYYSLRPAAGAAAAPAGSYWDEIKRNKALKMLYAASALALVNRTASACGV